MEAIPKPDEERTCSFCGRRVSIAQADALVAGTGGARICPGCVARLYTEQTGGHFAGRKDTDPISGHFDRFTDRARKVLTLAQGEAQRFNHNYIGTEHLLLGLVGEGEGVGSKVLADLGVGLADVRRAVEFIIGRGDRMVMGEIGLTPRAKKVIELAVDEARRMDHHYVGTEHLLLGLIGEGEGIACGVLESLGVNLERARTSIHSILGAVPGRAPGASASRPSDPVVFDRYTERARKVLTFAQEEAQRLGHNYMGPEHLLLALVREDDVIAAKALANLGVELAKVRGSIEFMAGRGDRRLSGDLGLTPRSKKVLELAVDEARRFGHPYIGTEHLLLGLVREHESMAAGVLENLGVSLETLRAEVLKILGTDPRPNKRGRGTFGAPITPVPRG